MKESGFVLTGMKMPWDAYRIASGAEQEKDTEFDPMTEMTFTKCIEMFAESIPGIIIQTSSIVKSLNSGESIKVTVLLSLLISLLSSGFISATISYDFDTDPKKRGEHKKLAQ